jgi:hypothetical protein
MFHRLGLLACSDSEIISETSNTFRHLYRTPWMGDQPVTRLIPTQDSTAQKNMDIHQYIEWDSNTQSQD